MNSNMSTGLKQAAEPSGRHPVRTGATVPSKIKPPHLERLAVVYVRQSTQQQVLEHRESTARQPFCSSAIPQQTTTTVPGILDSLSVSLLHCPESSPLKTAGSRPIIWRPVRQFHQR